MTVATYFYYEKVRRTMRTVIASYLLNKSNTTSPEAVAQRCSVKKVFLQIWQNSQENTCARVSFLIKLQPPFHTEHLWRLLLLLVKFLPGRTFRWKNIRGICFSDFGPKLRNQTLRKLLKLALSQKWSQFVKFNFCSNIFVYLAFMAEQLHNKD